MAETQPQQPPQIIFHERATAEQRDALEYFELVATEFSEPEVERAVVLVDRWGEASKDILPLTAQPDKTEALLDACLQVFATQAMARAEFDEATEAVIATDERIKRLLARLGSTSKKDEKESINRKIGIRRLIIFAGRVAISAAQGESGESSGIADPALEDAS